MAVRPLLLYVIHGRHGSRFPIMCVLRMKSGLKSDYCTTEAPTASSYLPSSVEELARHQEGNQPMCSKADLYSL